MPLNSTTANNPNNFNHHYNRLSSNNNPSNTSVSTTRAKQRTTNVIANQFQVNKKIGEGSFGIIYAGIDLKTNRLIAIKFESRRAEVPQLKDEFKAYRILQGTVGIPRAYFYGYEGSYNVLCIDLLGPSLEDLFDMCNRKFNVKTVAMLAKQMITRVQSVHEKSLIYRDIKPDNFLIGRPHDNVESNSVYMVDFGMIKQYRDPKTLQHIPYREKKSLSGTARYMSINTHLGREQSRRDDLESLGHVFMYFLRGSLPWQGLKAANNKQKYQLISETKQKTPLEELCAGFPREFFMYMSYTRNMAFEETPDYDFLRGLMDNVLKKSGYNSKDMFDWVTKSAFIREKEKSQIETLKKMHKESENTKLRIINRKGQNNQQSTSNINITSNNNILLNQSNNNNDSYNRLRQTIKVNSKQPDKQQNKNLKNADISNNEIALKDSLTPSMNKQKRSHKRISKIVDLLTLKSCYK